MQVQNIRFEKTSSFQSQVSLQALNAKIQNLLININSCNSKTKKAHKQ